jgi:hypothetical protein
MNSKDELSIDIETYNKIMDNQWPNFKKKMNLSGELHICIHCGRKYIICCICEKAITEWERMLKEIRDINELNNLP